MSSLCHRSSSRKTHSPAGSNEQRQGHRLGQLPYDKYKTNRPSHRSPSVSKPSPSSTSSSSTPRAPASFRDICLESILKKYPKFKPRNDFDILTLSANGYNGPEAGVYTWLDSELAIHVSLQGNVQKVIAFAERALSYKGIVTGHKPSAGDPDVLVRPIPQSRYSLRLFPGALERQEFCMDFVHTLTGQPVNSPFVFELRASPDGLGSTPGSRVVSLERSWGCAQKDIVPGEEKFVLRDGMVCTLRRPGHKDIRFTVPVRAASTKSEDVHELDFPSTV